MITSEVVVGEFVNDVKDFVVFLKIFKLFSDNFFKDTKDFLLVTFLIKTSTPLLLNFIFLHSWFLHLTEPWKITHHFPRRCHKAIFLLSFDFRILSLEDFIELLRTKITLLTASLFESLSKHVWQGDSFNYVQKTAFVFIGRSIIQSTIKNLPDSFCGRSLLINSFYHQQLERSFCDSSLQLPLLPTISSMHANVFSHKRECK